MTTTHSLAADRLIALAAGRLHAFGSPADVLTQDTVRTVFGLDSRIIEDPVSGRPLMLPVGRHHVGQITKGSLT